MVVIWIELIEPVNTISTLVVAMAWRQSDDKPLREQMMTKLIELT